MTAGAARWVLRVTVGCPPCGPRGFLLHVAAGRNADGTLWHDTEALGQAVSVHDRQHATRPTSGG